MGTSGAGQLPADAHEFMANWGSGWEFRGHTVSAVRPAAPMVMPRTHNGKRSGKRRWEPAVAFPEGMSYSGVLFKSKDKAEAWAGLLYRMALQVYDHEQLLRRVDALQIGQEAVERTLGRKGEGDGKV